MYLRGKKENPGGGNSNYNSTMAGVCLLWIKEVSDRKEILSGIQSIFHLNSLDRKSTVIFFFSTNVKEIHWRG